MGWFNGTPDVTDPNAGDAAAGSPIRQFIGSGLGQFLIPALTAVAGALQRRSGPFGTRPRVGFPGAITGGLSGLDTVMSAQDQQAKLEGQQRVGKFLGNYADQLSASKPAPPVPADTSVPADVASGTDLAYGGSGNPPPYTAPPIPASERNQRLAQVMKGLSGAGPAGVQAGLSIVPHTIPPEPAFHTAAPGSTYGTVESGKFTAQGTVPQRNVQSALLTHFTPESVALYNQTGDVADLERDRRGPADKSVNTNDVINFKSSNGQIKGPTIPDGYTPQMADAFLTEQRKMSQAGLDLRTQNSKRIASPAEKELSGNLELMSKIGDTQSAFDAVSARGITPGLKQALAASKTGQVVAESLTNLTPEERRLVASYNDLRAQFKNLAGGISRPNQTELNRLDALIGSIAAPEQFKANLQQMHGSRANAYNSRLQRLEKQGYDTGGFEQVDPNLTKPAPAGAPAAQPAAPVRQRAINPKTGETVEYDGKQWVPVK